mmetsp:Transcript_7804/g.16236  ORF Transcript_7804/g.16236 Transcript_7804/m.16236 type:complete len:83 (-) Transcript_7804:120-368(-)
MELEDVHSRGKRFESLFNEVLIELGSEGDRRGHLTSTENYLKENLLCPNQMARKNTRLSCTDEDKNDTSLGISRSQMFKIVN